MIMYEQDPDVVRWGLHLLNVCSTSTSGSPGSIIHYDKDLSQVGYVSEGYCVTICNEEENDETVARAFQEELSRLAAAEASGYSHAGEEHLQASVLTQDWQGSPKRCSIFSCCTFDSFIYFLVIWYLFSLPSSSIIDNIITCVENGDDQGEGDEGGEFCSCSSTGEKSLGLEDQPYSPEIDDESTLDGEVGKRLNQMVPLPHVPKINGEIPSVDEETSDHQRLLDRLHLYDLVELKVQGDGNCQFRALSDQIYRTTEHHKFVRQQVVDQLKSRPELYQGYVPMAYDDYLKCISKSGEWGDHVTLQAAADAYGVKVFIITSFKDTCYIEILPESQKTQRTIFLSFWAEVHYNSIYPEGELPALETEKKKKWWML